MDVGPGAARVHQGHVDDGRVVVARILPIRTKITYGKRHKVGKEKVIGW